MTTNQILSLAAVFVAMIAITYFTTIRPQQNRYKAHQNLLSDLQVGDRIMTAGGFIAKVASIDNENDTAVIELEPDGVKARINIRSVVTNMSQDQTVD